ncbi:MAG TPA: pyridoxal phosphate-dependent aminotransferase [Myxococcota bacterium]|nr:pyridoxal phosphate-dependent aminotransferase [Myxococcota bacterium]
MPYHASVFARRASWDLSHNDLSRRLDARRAAGLPILDLTESNPTRCDFSFPARLLREALERLASDPRAERYQPDAKGDSVARRAISDYHAAQGGAPTREHVVLTAGTSEAYAHLFRLLGDPGDRVLVPAPSYPLFGFLAELEGLEAAPYALRFRADTEEWRIDLDSLEAACDARTRAVVVVHPNNPTGGFVRETDLSALRSLCVRRELALISDEVFADYALDESSGRWPGTLLAGADAPGAPLTFVLSGVSKSLALPQLKLAWIVVAGPALLRDEALARLEVIADTYLTVNALGQLLLPNLLAGRAAAQAEILGRVRTNRAILRRALGAYSGATLLPADAGWCAIVRVQGMPGGPPPDEDALVAELLDGPGVLVQPGWFFDLIPDAEEKAAHLVLSLLPVPKVFTAGADALARICFDAAPPR